MFIDSTTPNATYSSHKNIFKRNANVLNANRIPFCDHMNRKKTGAGTSRFKYLITLVLWGTKWPIQLEWISEKTSKIWMPNMAHICEDPYVGQKSSG